MKHFNSDCHKEAIELPSRRGTICPQCKIVRGDIVHLFNVKCPGTNTKRPWTNFRGRGGGGALYTVTPGPNVATAQLIFYIACIKKKKNILYSVYLFIKVKNDNMINWTVYMNGLKHTESLTIIS